MGDEESLRAIVGYVDSVAEAGGLLPGLKGLVIEPWERDAIEDATGPQREYRGSEGSWHDYDLAARRKLH